MYITKHEQYHTPYTQPTVTHTHKHMYIYTQQDEPYMQHYTENEEEQESSTQQAKPTTKPPKILTSTAVAYRASRPLQRHHISY